MNPFPIHNGMLKGSNLVDLVQVMAAEFITEMLILCLEHGTTIFPPLLHNVPWPVEKEVI